jgi:hypothetical protein
MDVTSSPPIPGMTPHLADREPLRAALPRPGAGSAAAVALPVVAGGGAVSATPGEVAGDVDGPDLVLPTGVRIRRRSIGSVRIGLTELQQAIRGVSLLPIAHQQTIARMGIPIELVPVVQLERVPGTTDPVVGATRVTGRVGALVPERIRIAAYQSQVGTSVQEAVQHEIGHALAVAAYQDRSEDTAIAYAKRY